MTTPTQMSFDFDAPARPGTIEVDGREYPLRADGSLPYFVVARMMAGPNPTDDEARLWDDWKDEMKMRDC